MTHRSVQHLSPDDGVRGGEGTLKSEKCRKRNDCMNKKTKGRLKKKFYIFYRIFKVPGFQVSLKVSLSSTSHTFWTSLTVRSFPRIYFMKIEFLGSVLEI